MRNLKRVQWAPVEQALQTRIFALGDRTEGSVAAGYNGVRLGQNYSRWSARGVRGIYMYHDREER